MSALANPSANPAPVTRRVPWAVIGAVLTALVVAVAAAIGIRGLLANPVQGTDTHGVTTITGSFEPFGCDAAPGATCPPQGYVQAGGRSVFVILPGSCAAPEREQQITVRGHRDPAQGKQTYRAVDCGSR